MNADVYMRPDVETTAAEHAGFVSLRSAQVSRNCRRPVDDAERFFEELEQTYET